MRQADRLEMLHHLTPASYDVMQHVLDARGTVQPAYAEAHVRQEKHALLNRHINAELAHAEPASDALLNALAERIFTIAVFLIGTILYAAIYGNIAQCVKLCFRSF